jgi:hypothetical protein
MLFAQDGGQLFVNAFSPNRDRLRRSRLYEVVNAKGAVVDAEILEQQGKALLLGKDFAGPRGAGAQQTYLRAKYDILANVVHQTHWKGIVTIPMQATGATSEHPVTEPDSVSEAAGTIGEHDGG